MTMSCNNGVCHLLHAHMSYDTYCPLRLETVVLANGAVVSRNRQGKEQ